VYVFYHEILGLSRFFLRFLKKPRNLWLYRLR